jgi:hypothetical protein
LGTHAYTLPGCRRSLVVVDARTVGLCERRGENRGVVDAITAANDHRVQTGTSVALVEDANREPIQLKLRCALTDLAHNVQDGAPTNLCAFIWLH